MLSGVQILAGVSAFLLALGVQSGEAQTAPADSAPNVRSRLDALEVLALAMAITGRHLPRVDPCMLVAMAGIESSFNPRAYRFEAGVSNRYTPNGDASYGLLQVLYSTARWLHDEMGYKDYPLAGPDDLFEPQTSIYFGAAYVDWLRKKPNASEQFIVRAYNGGTGNAWSSATENHWRKYQDEKARLAREGVC